MNPVPLLWFWRGLKGHSVTFATLFASVALGVSLSGGVGKLLAALGVHWLYVLILPGLLFRWTAKRETKWLPDERRRRLVARSLLIGSLAVALLISWLRPNQPSAPAGSQGEAPPTHRSRP